LANPDNKIKERERESFLSDSDPFATQKEEEE
jgi:hypothetical protein